MQFTQAASRPLTCWFLAIGTQILYPLEMVFAAKPLAHREVSKADPPIETETFVLISTVGMDLLGPTQHQTFAYSEVSDQQKYDPNLKSYVGSVSLWSNSEYFSHGALLRGRVFLTYENTINRQLSQSTEVSRSLYTVAAHGYGIGYGLGGPLSNDTNWHPQLSLVVESSQVKLTEFRNSSAIAPQTSNQLNSRLVFSYVDLELSWRLSFSKHAFLTGISCKVPLVSKQFVASTTPDEDRLKSDLNHRTNVGVGVTVGAGFEF